jgi:hypothetical protein
MAKKNIICVAMALVTLSFLLAGCPPRSGEAAKKMGDARPDYDVETATRFDVDDMMLYRVIPEKEGNSALVRLPDGNEALVVVGDALGNRGGTVTEMGIDYVIVEEKHVDPAHPDKEIVVEKVLRLVELSR